LGPSKNVLKKPTKKHVVKQSSGDPLSDLGFGVVAYRDILWSLTWTFIFFTLILWP